MGGDRELLALLLNEGEMLKKKLNAGEILKNELNEKQLNLNAPDLQVQLMFKIIDACNES